MDTTAGQLCVQDFLKAVGLPGTDCFSQNGFTLQNAIDQITAALGSSPTPAELQANFTKLQNMTTGLISCLTATTPSSEAPSSQAPVSGGGGATAPSNVAPAATPVSGTPNFTG